MQFSEERWKMWENIDILNLSVQEEWETKFLTKNLLATEKRKKQNLVDKLVYLGLPILELNKILMYKFWHDYV